MKCLRTEKPKPDKYRCSRMDMMVLTVFLGALVGIVMGLTGAGGGILAVPLLVFGLHLTIVEAGPVAMLAVGISATVGALLGLKANIVRYRATLLIAVSGILMAPLGVWIANRLDTRLMNLIFAAVLGWVAYKTLYEIYRKDPELQIKDAPPCIRNNHSGRFIWTNTCAVALSLSGTIAGALSGLLGVGGGFVIVPALQRYTDFDMQSVIATSLAIIALVSLTSVGASVYAGHLNFGIGLPFVTGSVLGMGAASIIGPRLPQKYLKTAFGIMCFIVAIAMIVKVL